MKENSFLHMALIHLGIKHKEPEQNRAAILELNEQAAVEGADIIVNPEMAISGYSFQSRDEIRDFTETLSGETISALKNIAKQYSSYICIGLAERDESSDIFYNSAIVVGPSGDIVCHYRKINAELRWGCPGQPQQENVFMTPWGNVGVLICSDSYYGLMPRATALRGAHMLLIPANWPPSGLNPLELWQARALENEVYLAACNRCGKDLRMSCEDAACCVYDHRGQALFMETVKESKIHIIDIPLQDGRLPNYSQRNFINTRELKEYVNIYLDMRLINDYTSHYEMPQPGELHITCVAAYNHSEASPEALAGIIDKFKLSGDNLFVFSRHEANATQLKEIAATKDVIIIADDLTGENTILATPSDLIILKAGNEATKMVDYGPARIGICRPEQLYHPEAAVNLSKIGCDLVVTSCGQMDEGQHLLWGIRTIEQIAVAVAGQNRAFISTPPEGHQRWQEEKVIGEGVCQMTIDTSKTRSKRFQDRVDFELLLRKSEDL